MLELIGVKDVTRLAQRDPGELHQALHQLNATERRARRAPTPEEVENWVRQAQTLTQLIDVCARARQAAGRGQVGPAGARPRTSAMPWRPGGRPWTQRAAWIAPRA